MQHTTAFPPKTQPTFYVRTFLIVLMVASVGQYIWWVTALLSGHYGTESDIPQRIVFGGVLWIIHLLLFWITPNIKNRRFWPLFYICVQCVIGAGINYVTAPFFLGFNIYIILVGQSLGIFQNIPLAILAFGLSLISKEVNNYAYYQVLYKESPPALFELALSSIVRSDALYILINIPFVASVYLQYRARWRTQTLLQELDTAHRELASYASQVKELTLVAERARIARELHDTLAQGLTGVSLQLEALDAYLAQGKPEKAQQIIIQMKQRTKEALASSRTAIKDLRSASVSSKPLLVSIQEYAEQFSAVTGISCTLEMPILATLEQSLPEATIEHVLRCLGESLSNIERHAEATEVAIRVEQTLNTFNLYITDDGIGFELQAGLNKNGHFGLVGLQERARLMGGSVDIVSAPGKGTKVHFRIDLTSTEAKTPAEKSKFELPAPITSSQ